MATSTTSDEHANLLENFIDNVRAALAQIEEGETKKQNPKDFNPDVYWKKFGDVFKALSHEGTKLTMAFSSPPAPSPEALEGLLGSFEKAVQALVSFYYTLPKRQGITLRKVVRKSVMRCLESVIILVENLKQGNAGNSEQLQSTGALWQEVDNFSSIPRDNKSALLEVLKRNMHLVSDALQELDQALEIDGEDEGIEEFLGNSQQNHGNNASSWSDRDKDIIVSCLPLIKASKSILKKTHAAVRLNGRCSSEEEISQLDDLGDYIESMSPKVDEFATSLYPPLKGPNVLQHGEDLHKLNTTLLGFLRQSHITAVEDHRWLDFLMKASTHNWTKLKTLTLGS
ncbi:hypothetical protein CHS0354_009387 [Potamilus streckersoni]|uniref:Cyclin-D1-binding protein 1 n=1 Tax=Potamilus streckersoni TaxID=2493646 RepID=A0AAE0W7M0_9BIVA|nr:hypothetical protein CHS0354_009387 [Potamilus streckersoni]